MRGRDSGQLRIRRASLRVELERPARDDPRLPIAAVAYGVEGAIGTGKALSEAAAVASAIGELTEREASAAAPAGLLRARLAELDGDALDPRRLCPYPDATYATGGFAWHPYQPSRELAWAEGSWLDAGPVWVPAHAVWEGLASPAAERFVQRTSSGLGAGATLEAAIRHAVLELVERDALVISWRARRPGLVVSPEAVLDDGSAELTAQLRETGARIELYLLDVGLPVPVVACLGLGDGVSWPGAILGLGCGLDLAEAAARALLEQGHVGPSLRRGVRERRYRIPAGPERVRVPLDHALYYVPPERAIALDVLRGHTTAPVDAPALADLDELVRALADAGVRVAVVDITTAAARARSRHVVRAVSPDLQPIDFGHGLERLPVPRLARLTDDPEGAPHPLA